MLGPLYRRTWIWGRPYTYVIRDAWKQEPTTFLFLFLALGMVAGRYLIQAAFWWVVGALFVGVLLGHLFWPTSYGLGRRIKRDEDDYGRDMEHP